MRSALCGFLCIALAGCATSSRLVEQSRIENSVQVEWKAPKSGPMEFSFRGAILPNSSDSWVKDAQWNEYFIHMRNSGTQSITVESVELASALGAPVVHSTSLDELADGSYENLRFAKNALGTTVVATMVPPVAGVFAMYSSGSAFAGAAAWSAMIPIAAAGGAAFFGYTTWRDARDRRTIQDTIRTRGLTLPMTLMPDQMAQGSAFFSFAPLPHKVVVRYRAGESASTSHTSTVDLASFDGLLSNRRGCGKSMLLESPLPLLREPPLLLASTQNLMGTLESVVVPNAPGSWAKDADWDEYALQVKNLGNGTLRITGAFLVDSLGRTWLTGTPQCALSADQRWENVPTPAKVISAMLGGYGATRMIVDGQHLQIMQQIGERRSSFPIEVSPHGESSLRLLFPVIPLPEKLRIDYVVGGETRHLELDTTLALATHHLKNDTYLIARPLPDQATQQLPSGDGGYVRAKLALDEAGKVKTVSIYGSMPKGQWDELAIATMSRWQYNAGRDARLVDAFLEFNPRR